MYIKLLSTKNVTTTGRIMLVSTNYTDGTQNVNTSIFEVNKWYPVNFDSSKILSSVTLHFARSDASLETNVISEWEYLIVKGELIEFKTEKIAQNKNNIEAINTSLVNNSSASEDILTSTIFENISYNGWASSWIAGNRLSNYGHEINGIPYKSILFNIANNYLANVMAYDVDTNEVGYHNNFSGTYEYVLPNNTRYIRFLFKKSDDTNITVEEIQSNCSISAIRSQGIKIAASKFAEFQLFALDYIGKETINVKTDIFNNSNNISYKMIYGNIVNGAIQPGATNRLCLCNHIPIDMLNLHRITVATLNYINAFIYLYDEDGNYVSLNMQQNVGDNHENFFEIILPYWNMTKKAVYFNICLRINNDSYSLSWDSIADDVEIMFYKKPVNKAPYETPAEYWKDWIFDRLKHCYYTDASIIQAQYLGFVKPVSIPVALRLTVPDNKYTWIVRYYNYISNNSVVEAGNSGWTSVSTKQIMPNSTVCIVFQNKDTAKGSLYIPWQELYNDMTVEVEPQIAQLTREQFLPYPLTNNYTSEHRLCLMHFSDNHNNSSIIAEMAKYYHWHSDYITDCINTGDIVNDDSTDDFTFWGASGAGDILTCIGNHDAKHTENGTVTFLSETEKYSIYFEPFISSWGVQSVNNRTWYHKIYVNEGIILLVYDSMVTEDNAEEMYTYIQNTLNYALTNNYSVIMAEHFSIAKDNATTIECAFTGIGGLFDDLLIKNFSIKDRTHSLVKDFTDSGGDFICFLTGHIHSNILAYHTEYKQLDISIASAGLMQGIQANDTIRQNYTKSRYEFNLVYPCRSTHTITIQRIGANKDRLCRVIDSITVDYKTMRVIQDLSNEFTDVENDLNTLKDDITNDITNIEEDLSNITKATRIEYIEGQYVQTTNPLTMVDGKPVPTGPSNAWKCAIIPCSEGDVFTINGASSNANLRAWRFSKADGYYISESANPFSSSDNLVLVAPANSAWLVLNSSNLTSISYIGKLIPQSIEDLISYTDESIKENIGSVQVEYIIGKYVETTNPLTMENGVPVTTGTSGAWKSAILPCVEGDVFTINGASNNANLRAWFFATSTGAYISESANNFDVDDNLVLTAPSNSAWLILNSNALTRESYVGKTIDAKFDEVWNSLATKDDSNYNDSLLLDAFSKHINPIEITEKAYVSLQIDNGGVVHTSTQRKSVICKIVPGTYIDITKIQTLFAWLGFSTEYPKNGTVLNSHYNKNGATNTEIGLQAGSNDNYMIFMYYDSTHDDGETAIQNSMHIFYDCAEYSQFDMIAHADERMINLLKYRPVGKVQKPYIAISCDDGNAVLATYTIPRIKYWKETYGKNIPVTFALMDNSDVMLDATYKELVKDACENYGSAVAIHGAQSYLLYPTRKMLMQYIERNDKYLYTELGVKPTAVIYPEHQYNDVVQTICGSYYNACGCGGIKYNYVYSDANDRPFYIGEKSNCYEIYRLAIHDTRITSLSDVEDIIDFAYDNNFIICPYFHDVDLGDTAPNKDYLRSVLDKFVSYGLSKGIEFIKLGDIPYVL